MCGSISMQKTAWCRNEVECDSWGWCMQKCECDAWTHRQTFPSVLRHLLLFHICTCSRATRRSSCSAGTYTCWSPLCCSTACGGAHTWPTHCLRAFIASTPQGPTAWRCLVRPWRTTSTGMSLTWWSPSVTWWVHLVFESPWTHLHMVGMLRFKPTELAHSFLFSSCICFCLYDLFYCISFHKFSWQLSAFSLCSSSLISALLVLSTIYTFTKSSLSPDITLWSWLGLKHQLTS